MGSYHIAPNKRLRSPPSWLFRPAQMPAMLRLSITRITAGDHADRVWVRSFRIWFDDDCDVPGIFGVLLIGAGQFIPVVHLWIDWFLSCLTVPYLVRLTMSVVEDFLLPVTNHENVQCARGAPSIGSVTRLIVDCSSARSIRKLSEKPGSSRCQWQNTLW